jgi:hypothetical protein
MKIIFIDLDDVFILHKGLNAIPQYPHELKTMQDVYDSMDYYKEKLDITCVKNLKELANQNVFIVVHSSWRRYFDLSQFKTMFSKYGIDENKIIDICQDNNGSSKINAISSYIQRNNIQDYVIIDDDASLSCLDKFILINPELGFDTGAYIQAKKMLNI